MKIPNRIFGFLTILLIIISSYAVGITITTNTRFYTTDVVMYQGSFDFHNYTNFTLHSKIVTSNDEIFNVSEANFVHAIYSLNATGGGWVHIPICNISINQTIKPTSNVLVKGYGNKSIITMAPQANRSLFYVTENNVVFENICFYGANRTQRHGGNVINNAVYNNSECFDVTSGAQHFRVFDCTFLSWYATPIRIKSTAKFAIIENCFFYKREEWRYGGAMGLSGAFCIAKNNVIRDMYGAGIGMEGDEKTTNNIVDGNIITGNCAGGVWMEGAYNSQNATIINNIIYDANSNCYTRDFGAWTHGGTGEIYGILAMNGTLVANNYISNISYRGISLYGSASAIGNTLINCGYNASQYAIMRYPSTSVFGNTTCRIENNNIFSRLDRANPAAIIYGANALVTGNTILCTGNYGPAQYVIGYADVVSNNRLICIGDIKPDKGIHNSRIVTGNYIRGCDIGIGNDYQNVGIWSNNNISECSYSGIEIKRSKNFTVQGNVINLSTGSAVAIRIDRSTGCLINGNIIISGTGTYGIKEETFAEFNVITNNNVLNCSGNKISRKGNSTIVRDNMGYYSESSGTCSITSGSSSVKVGHNLSSRPNCVTVVPMGNTTCVNGMSGFNISYSNTRIMIFVPGKLVNNCKFYWYCSNTTGGAIVPS